MDKNRSQTPSSDGRRDSEAQSNSRRSSEVPSDGMWDSETQSNSRRSSEAPSDGRRGSEATWEITRDYSYAPSNGRRDSETPSEITRGCSGPPVHVRLHSGVQSNANGLIAAVGNSLGTGSPVDDGQSPPSPLNTLPPTEPEPKPSSALRIQPLSEDEIMPTAPAEVAPRSPVAPSPQKRTVSWRDEDAARGVPGRNFSLVEVVEETPRRRRTGAGGIPLPPAPPRSSALRTTSSLDSFPSTPQTPPSAPSPAQTPPAPPPASPGAAQTSVPPAPAPPAPAQMLPPPAPAPPAQTAPSHALVPPAQAHPPLGARGPDGVGHRSTDELPTETPALPAMPRLALGFSAALSSTRRDSTDHQSTNRPSPWTPSTDPRPSPRQDVPLSEPRPSPRQNVPLPTPLPDAAEGKTTPRGETNPVLVPLPSTPGDAGAERLPRRSVSWKGEELAEPSRARSPTRADSPGLRPQEPRPCHPPPPPPPDAHRHVPREGSQSARGDLSAAASGLRHSQARVPVTQGPKRPLHPVTAVSATSGRGTVPGPASPFNKGRTSPAHKTRKAPSPRKALKTPASPMSGVLCKSSVSEGARSRPGTATAAAPGQSPRVPGPVLRVTAAQQRVMRLRADSPSPVANGAVTESPRGYGRVGAQRTPRPSPGLVAYAEPKSG